MKLLHILGYPKCAQWRFWSDCANAQSDLNLRWAPMSEGMFSDGEAQIYRKSGLFFYPAIGCSFKLCEFSIIDTLFRRDESVKTVCLLSESGCTTLKGRSRAPDLTALAVYIFRRITKTYLYNFKTPFLYSKTGVYRGIHYFSYFPPKPRLWVLVRAASTRRLWRVPTIYVLSRNMNTIRIFIWNFSVFGGEIFNIFK